MFYDDNVIEEVRLRNDIVDVIGGYVSLTHKGNSYTCCCPFHHEKTPSFHVRRDRQMFKCFGCGISGNVYTFVMQYENYTFPETIKYLAERAGYTLPEREISKEEKAKENYKLKLKDANKSAAGFYHYLLTQTPRGETARKYFENRGITEETIAKFGLGYADKYSVSLYGYLKSKEYTDAIMRDAGLVDITENKGAHDVFWNRVIIPIADINGKVIAFGGRVLGTGEPKYLNTKDTMIFNKRHNLFAMNIARKTKRRGLIICEGYMDVISLHQAGFDNAVASLGTAFTINQANLIKRYTDEVYLAYDSDGAGTKATLKNIAILRQVGIYARVIDMKPYKDPDEFIQALGKEAYEERINSAITGVDFEIGAKSQQYNLAIPEEKAKFANEAARVLSELEDAIMRSGYIDMISEKYNIDKVGLKSKVSQYGEIAMKSETTNYDEDEGKVVTVNTTTKSDEHQGEKLLLTWLVNDTVLFEKLAGVISEDDFIDEDYHQVASKLFEQYKNTGQVQPATIVNMFDDVEKQNLVGNILQTELPFEISIEEKEKAINEVIKRVKLARIEHERSMCGDDVEKLSKLITQQASLGKLNISIR